jgi:hypothetical protein
MLISASMGPRMYFMGVNRVVKLGRKMVEKEREAGFGEVLISFSFMVAERSSWYGRSQAPPIKKMASHRSEKGLQFSPQREY